MCIWDGGWYSWYDCLVWHVMAWLAMVRHGIMFGLHSMGCQFYNIMCNEYGCGFRYIRYDTKNIVHTKRRTTKCSTRRLLLLLLLLPLLLLLSLLTMTIATPNKTTVMVAAVIATAP